MSLLIVARCFSEIFKIEMLSITCFSSLSMTLRVREQVLIDFTFDSSKIDIVQFSLKVLSRSSELDSSI